MANVQKRRVTITDVAALAGVSKGAVSRSFNGAERLPQSTVDRIHEAAEQLGWRPNAAARAIKGASSNTIGFIINRDPNRLSTDPFFPLFLAGLEQVLSANAYSLMIRFVSDTVEEEHCYRDWAAENRIDGFVVADLRGKDSRYQLLDELKIPAVLVGEPPEDIKNPAVFNRAEHCITELLEGWVELGHTRIGHVMGDPEHLNSRQRRGIWESVLAKHGLKTDLVGIGSYTTDDSAKATQKLMRAADRPTAIFYSSDVMAAAGMTELTRLGYKVGVDVAVAGFDDIPLDDYLSPALATISCDYGELGAKAASVLLDEFTSPTEGLRVALPGKFVRRASYEATLSDKR
jgi:DNA-binding LacI/PurR family transcriptional regulator